MTPDWIGICHDLDTIRYEIRIGEVPDTGEVGILEERVLLKKTILQKNKTDFCSPWNRSAQKRSWPRDDPADRSL